MMDANNTDHYPLMMMVFPELPSFLVLAFFMIATLLTVIVYKRASLRQKSLICTPTEDKLEVQK